MAVPSDAPSYDPYTDSTMRIQFHAAAVFNGLIRTNPEKKDTSIANIIPDLAEKWTISPDGKTYTFSLRKGVKFHDGHPFTAEDVKYSLDKYRDIKQSVWASNVSMIDSVNIVDDFTVTVVLKYAYPEIVSFLVPPYCSIVPAHLKAVNPKSTDFLVGTGPFKFKENIPGKMTAYERNPDYFVQGLPYLDRVECYYGKTDALVDAFIGGQLDTCGNLRDLLDQDIAFVQKVKKLAPEAKIYLEPSGSSRGLFFNFVRKGAWNDVRVRKAMSMVIDYDAITLAASGGPEMNYVSMAGLIPYYVKGSLTKDEVARLIGANVPMDARVAAAKKLMADAGYADGFKAELIYRAGEPQSENASIYAADMWKKYLNINITLKGLDQATLFPRRDNGDFDLDVDSVVASTGSVMVEFLNSFVTNGNRNHGDWSNKEYDTLTQKIAEEPDENKRIEMARQAQTIYFNEMPFISFHGSCYGTTARPDLMTGSVQGIVTQPAKTTYMSIDRIWFANTPDAKRWIQAK